MGAVYKVDCAESELVEETGIFNMKFQCNAHQQLKELKHFGLARASES